jgi:exopolysaccharide biosynthesis polyprenyl glycosylphosphotransferase
MKTKYLLDKILSVFVLVLLAPVILIIAFIIRLDSPGHVFFFQERAGKNGRRFRSIKFRTMIPEATKTGLGLNIKADDTRITRVGKFLRTWSLDELPQFFNVLKGDMSIVGPRPTLQYQIERYDDFQRKRLLVRPGITGWAQVNGRNAITWEQRIKYDVWYVENQSLWLDINIIFKTLKVVLKREGLYGTNGTNDDFMINSNNAKP